MKAKKYKITSYADMVNCVNMDNVGCFIKDLEHCLRTILAVKTMHEIAGKDFNAPDSYLWIDDGKHKHKITIKIKPE